MNYFDPMPCGCSWEHRSQVDDTIIIDGNLRVMMRARCVYCHSWLSLGPSDDSPPAVQIEIRAAELARRAIEAPTSTLLSNIGCDGAEIAGWIIAQYDLEAVLGSLSDSEHAGYLARLIVEYERSEA